MAKLIKKNGADSNYSPKLVVFDLDFTLWPLWVDTHVDPPFIKRNGEVFDRVDYKVKLFPDALNILHKLKEDGIKIAVASRTGAIDCAEQLLHLFDLNKFFDAKQIYPGCKLQHFEHFREHLGIDYKDMVFFDDEHRNIHDLTKVGVTAIHVPHGINMKVFKRAMEKFAKEN